MPENNPSIKLTPQTELEIKNEKRISDLNNWLEVVIPLRDSGKVEGYKYSLLVEQIKAAEIEIANIASPELVKKRIQDQENQKKKTEKIQNIRKTTLIGLGLVGIFSAATGAGLYIQERDHQFILEQDRIEAQSKKELHEETRTDRLIYKDEITLKTLRGTKAQQKLIESIDKNFLDGAIVAKLLKLEKVELADVVDVLNDKQTNNIIDINMFEKYVDSLQ